MIRFRRLTPLVLIGLLGCGHDDDTPKVFPVSGRILVNGRPAPGAELSFHSLSAEDEKKKPFAIADANGSYRPSTRLANDGAPAGDYAVTVVWPKVIKGVGGEEDRGPDQLRDRFSSPQRPAAKVTIIEGDNQLPPIELKR